MDADAKGCLPAEIAVAFVEHAANPDGPHAEHLRRCPDCATAVRELRADPGAGPDLEMRLLRDFHNWRDGT